MSIKDELKEDVEKIGELHAVIEEHDAELEIRQGQVEWYDDCFEVDVPGHPVHVFQYDRVVSWYEPDGLWH